jgi:hypothetical protein
VYILLTGPDTQIHKANHTTGVNLCRLKLFSFLYFVEYSLCEKFEMIVVGINKTYCMNCVYEESIWGGELIKTST